MNEQDNTVTPNNLQQNTDLLNRVAGRLANASKLIHRLQSCVQVAKTAPLEMQTAIDVLNDAGDAGLLDFLDMDMPTFRADLLNALCWLADKEDQS